MTTMLRRHSPCVLAAAWLLVLTPHAMAADAGARTWAFEVSLDERVIGRHVFTLRNSGDERELTSAARFDVKLLGFTAYRYVHDASERWAGNCLTAITAATDDNGARQWIKAAREGDRLKVTTHRGDEALDDCVMSYAYWNPRFLSRPRLLNSQTGEYQSVSVIPLGVEQLTVRGVPISAQRYRVTGPKHPIDVWYSGEKEWLALESVVDGGRRLRYRLL